MYIYIYISVFLCIYMFEYTYMYIKNHIDIKCTNIWMYIYK